PLGPGEAPLPFTDPARPPDAEKIAVHIRGLGSPMFSGITALPLGQFRGGARFGLDLGQLLAKAGKPLTLGTYLVGIRRLSGPPVRSWMRVQVTDIALTTAEVADDLRVLVTSLNSGEPKVGATVRVSGWQRHNDQNRWTTFLQRQVGENGAFDWRVEGDPPESEVMRIVVEHGPDRLVLDPSRPPEVFAHQRWEKDHSSWLQWTRGAAGSVRVGPTRHCHVFTERPVYRPDELVHIKGWLRTRELGRFNVVGGKLAVVVRGPGGREWRYSTELSPSGTFYHAFDEQELPSGEYVTYVDVANWPDCGLVSFKKEAYKVPEFEVRLTGPDRVPLDKPFEMSATAHYYAGGGVSERPLTWRVTQFPYEGTWLNYPGFRFSSTHRFGGERRLGGENVASDRGATDSAGSSQILVNPAAEQSAQPRRYVFEATVTGLDGRTVTATREVLGLPAFALGLKHERVWQGQRQTPVSVVVPAADGKLLGGHPITVKLFKREWHAQLRTGDFSSGVAKYVTETVDALVHEQVIDSRSDGPVELMLPTDGRGVYVVDLEARDGLGRVQSIRGDFFVTGEDAVTWSRPPSRVFDMTSDKRRYRPGETARLVLQSPYQTGRALIVTEAPDANRYQWVPVVGGTAVIDVPISAHHAPRLSVHGVLMRGRIANQRLGNGLDLGRPVTLAATTRLNIEPSDNTLTLALDLPPKARPGEVVTLKIKLSDADGSPVAGEVTAWLVDQAVLALGREQRLTPLPDFLSPRPSRLRVHDTRNSLFGFLPFEEYAGGGAGELEPLDLIDNVTVRRRFVPVAYYNPAIEVDASGEAQVQIELPDNLTNFRVRAKGISGAGRFGHATDSLAIRMPFMVQPQLPRFVRRGDQFDETATVRATDGVGSEVVAEIRVDGADVSDPSGQARLLTPTGVESLQWPTSVAANAEFSEVSITVAVQRQRDAASDAFEVVLPI
ncbi:MAG: alpha-2-macroglobulin, partial [Chromatiales bacterium]|nr:alpha-2-macroglobulin [Chromatiales bacterium]